MSIIGHFSYNGLHAKCVGDICYRTFGRRIVVYGSAGGDCWPQRLPSPPGGIPFCLAESLAHSFVFGGKAGRVHAIGIFAGLAWGRSCRLSLRLQAILMIAVALFMIGTALALMDVHPMFRFFILEPPAFLRRLVRRQSKQDHWFAPAILGAFTIFIPCGTTQAMMAPRHCQWVSCVGRADPFTFVLGTSPLFFSSDTLWNGSRPCLPAALRR